ncbi:DUF1700 domain-containing protein [Lacticaseibacillus daqingensis]|uniref:DUF1700 domain-containing protein n=1 Tax=Lacticaseibacillus daqingensis TaxID=2486014 RepID=UPI000F7833E4|nr:DUF1700 domain-containing protein [Lacticaseibacillus daqingensis]
MTRETFLMRLGTGLRGHVPAGEAKRLVAYYDEMIQDLIEDGSTEADAVAQVGDPNDLVFAAAQSVPETPSQPAHPRLLLWLLLILGAPLWGALAVAALCVVASLDLILWCGPLIGACLASGFTLGGGLAVVVSPFALIGTFDYGLTQLGAGLLLLGAGLLIGWATWQLTRLCWRGHALLFRWVATQWQRPKAVFA